MGSRKFSGDALKVLKLEKELKKLESYLEDKSGINELSNFELMRTSIGSIPKEQREEAKAAREKVIATVKNKHKLTIKKALLDKFVRKLKPSLGASDLSDAENLGVHAVLLSDPETGEKIRVADKATFDVVNDFNFAIRNQISGLVRSTDDVASLESRGGIVGQMKIRIADLLGNRELAISRNAKKIFADNLGDHAPMTLRNVAKMLNGGRDVEGLKRKIEAVVDATLDELQNMLKEFNKHKDSPDIAYRLKLRNGKTIGLSAETIKRTQVTFAEARRNLQELKDKIHAAKTFENVIAVLYGRMAKQAHASEPDAVIDESLNEEFQSEVLIEKRNFTDFDRYREITDAQSLIQIYVATVLMATVIYKAEDKHGQKFLRDKTNYRMMKYNNSMSALNFWGFAVWRSKNPVVSKVLQPKVAAGLHRIVSKVPPQWVRDLHLDLSFAGNVQIDWDDHLRMMKYLLQHSGGTAGIDRITSLVDDAFNYEKLSFDQKTKFLPKLYFFATQFVPSSPLITRVRYIQNTLLGSGFDPLDDVDSTVVFSPGAEVNKLLGEDGEIATGADAEYSQTTATDARATVAAHIASRDSGMSAMKNQGLGMKRTIVKRKRNPDIKFKKFERPKEEQKS